MGTIPIVAIIGAAVVAGVYNLTLRLRGQRKATMIGIHVLLGIGALELLVFLLKDVNDGEGIAAGRYGNIAAGLLALAVFIGLISPIVAKNSRPLSNALLVAHIASGSVGAIARM